MGRRGPKVGVGGMFDPVSREGMLLANNVLLMVATAAVLLGTLYPLVLDAPPSIRSRRPVLAEPGPVCVIGWPWFLAFIQLALSNGI